LAVKIRLRRVGAKKQPSYRVVVADSRSPRDGRFIEIIGFYNPRTEPTTIRFDEDKVRKWLGHGAQPTDTVASLLYRAGIVDMRRERFRDGYKKVFSRDAAAAGATGGAPEPSTAAEETVSGQDASAPDASAEE
jgi:small subunit ribosomal protein S16